jgi:hypothetical protein
MNYGSKQAQEGHFRNYFPMNWGFGGIEFGFLGMSFTPQPSFQAY